MKKKHLLTHMSIKTRFILTFTAILTASVIAMLFITDFLYFRIVENKATELAQQYINQSALEVENSVDIIENIATILSMEDMVTKKLTGEYEDTRYTKYFEGVSELETFLFKMQSFIVQDINGIYIIGENGNYYKSNIDPRLDKDFRKEEWYKTIMEANGAVLFGIHEGAFTSDTPDKKLISIGMPIYDINTGNGIGVVLIDIKPDMIADKLLLDNFGINGTISIYDGKNEVISSNYSGSTKELIASVQAHKNSAAENSSFTLDNNSELAVYCETDFGWNIVGVMSTADLVSERSSALVAIITSVFVLLIFISIVIIRTSRSLTKPLNKLVSAMEQVEHGDFSVRLNERKGAEFITVTRGFNLMAQRIKELIDNIEEEHKKLNYEKLRVLQEQINPHFFYNTLDSIVWLSLAGRQDDVHTMVNSLISHFRIALSKGRDIIHVEQELEHVRSYLKILSIRFSDSFTYDIDADDEVMEYSTMKLVLQPIVENAINHGIKEKRSGTGHIFITAYLDGNNLVYEVMDSGIGMTKEFVDNLNTQLKKGGVELTKMNSFGLANVNERIRIYYGKEYGVTVSSAYMAGTTVKIVIPARKEL
ncbi:MAG: sensor histidine kinase [Christensenellaceae bacterium]|nr:sensor histidine kinase [Christensenellaceae bacterium]